MINNKTTAEQLIGAIENYFEVNITDITLSGVIPFDYYPESSHYSYCDGTVKHSINVYGFDGECWDHLDIGEEIYETGAGGYSVAGTKKRLYEVKQCKYYMVVENHYRNDNDYHDYTHHTLYKAPNFEEANKILREEMVKKFTKWMNNTEESI